MIRVHLD